MPDRKLNIDVEINKKYKDTKSSGTDADSKAENERLEQLKANLKQKQSLLDADIAKTQTQLKHAKDMELEAERHGNREKIKEMIAWRKMMESELRLLEANKRLANSKDLAEFKQHLSEKNKAQKEFDRLVRNAPRTNLRGDIGSLAYTQQLVSKQSGMLPGSTEFIQTGKLIDQYKAKLSSAGVDVRSLSQKIGGELSIALNNAAKSFLSSGLAAGAAAVSIAALWDAMKSGVELLELKAGFEGTAQQLNNLREATNNTVSEAGLIKLSNQAKDLGISLEDQVILFALSERAGDKYGSSIEENMQKAINVTEGMTKGVKQLGIQKAEYEKILQELVKTAGGEIEILQSEGQEREISIKKLDPEIQKRLRLQALIQASGITYEQALNQQSSWNDTLQESIVGLEDLKTYLGIGLTAMVNFASPIGPLAGAIRNLNKAISEIPGQIENFDRAILSLVNDIPLIGASLKDTLEGLGQFIGLLDNATDAMRDLGNSQKMSMESLVKGWTGTYEQGVNQLMLLKQISREEAEALIKPYVHFAKEHEAENSNRNNSTKSPGTRTKQVKEEKDAVDELIRSIDTNIKQQELQLKLEGKKPALISETIIKELEKLLAFDRTNLKQEQLVKLLEKEAELRDRIRSLIAKGQDAENKDPKSAPGTPKGSTPPRAKEQGSSDDDYYKKLQEVYDEIAEAQISAFSQSLSLTQQIDQVLGGGAGDVINAFQSAYSITQAIVELFDTLDKVSSLFDLIPGVGALGAIPGLADGGHAEAGRLYEWSEEGKELFIPTQSGYVLNADNFNRFSGAVMSMSDTINRDRDMVSRSDLSAFATAAMMMGNAASLNKVAKTGAKPPTVVVKNILPKVVPFKKAFELETQAYNAEIATSKS